MKNATQHFLLGLATLGFFALFMATIVFLSPAMRLPGQTIRVFFSHETGMAPLKIGSPVLLGGSVEVGQVRDVRIQMLADPNTPNARPQTVFLVTAELRNDLSLWGDCQITTDQPALGGTGYLSIISVGTQGTRLAQPIPGLPPQSFQASVATLSRLLLAEDGLVSQLTRAVSPEAEGSPMQRVIAILDDVKATTLAIRSEVSPADARALLGKLHQILSDVTEISAALRLEAQTGNNSGLMAKIHIAAERLGAALGEVNELVKEERPVIRETLADVRDVARTVNREMLAQVRAELDPNSPSTLLGKTHRAMDQVNTALADFGDIAATGEQLVKVSRPQLELVVGNVVSASQNLDQLVLKVLLNPRTLFFAEGGSQRELAVLQSARSFATAASQLNDTAQRLEAMLASLPADPGNLSPEDAAELGRVRTGIRAAFDRFQEAEQKLFDDLR